MLILTFYVVFDSFNRGDFYFSLKYCSIYISIDFVRVFVVYYVFVRFYWFWNFSIIFSVWALAICVILNLFNVSFFFSTILYNFDLFLLLILILLNWSNREIYHFYLLAGSPSKFARFALYYARFTLLIHFFFVFICNYFDWLLNLFILILFSHFYFNRWILYLVWIKLRTGSPCNIWEYEKIMTRE